MSFKIKSSLLVIWRLLKIIIGIVIYIPYIFIALVPMLLLFIIYMEAAAPFFYYVVHGRKPTNKENRNIDGQIAGIIEHIVFFPFPLLLKDRK